MRIHRNRGAWRERLAERITRRSKRKPIDYMAIMTMDFPFEATDNGKLRLREPHPIIDEHIGDPEEMQRAYTIDALPMELARKVLKRHLNEVTSIIAKDDGWHLYQGDDLLAVLSHGKLTNRVLVEAINRQD